ncbi:MAG: DMT family transporter [Pseudomonadota bacterium]
MNSKIGRGVSLALVCLCILGAMPVIANSRPAEFSALSFALFLSIWQVVFGLPLFVWELRSGRSGIFSMNRRADNALRAVTVTLITGVMFGLSTYLYVLGVEKAGAVNAAIAIQAYPLFAILWETVFLKRRKTPVELALTSALVATLYYLGTGGSWKVDGFSIWLLVALGVPFLWSIAHVLIKEELGRTAITPAQVTLFRVAISAVFLAAVLAVTEPAGFLDSLTRVDLQKFAALMGLVYYLELVVWFYAVRDIDVSLASSITAPWPALTMVLAVMFLGDRIELYQVVAFLVAVVAIYGLIVAGMRKGADS